MSEPAIPPVTLLPWPPGDLEQLRRMNAPEMMTHLGGPESEQKLVARNQKYLRLWAEGTARQFRIAIDGEPKTVGSVGYWLTEWQDEPVFETGWAIETAFQRRGIARRALALVLDDAAAQQGPRRVMACPRVDNAASNALCRSLGFTLIGEADLEYPPGVPMRANEWVIDLDTR